MDQNTKDVLTLLIPTLGAAVTAYVALQQAKLAHKVKTVADDLRKVEVSTNSMKDALVAATAKASHSEGKEEERAEQRIRQADQAVGAMGEMKAVAVKEMDVEVLTVKTDPTTKPAPEAKP